MGHRRPIAIVILVITIFVMGCGGSSKSLTSAELIAKADPICARINAKIAYYSNLRPSNSEDLVSKASIAGAAPQISTVERNALADLRKLAPPSAFADDWKQILADMQTVTEDTTKVGEAAKGKNINIAPNLVSSATSTLQHLRSVAARDGFKECAKIT